MPFGRSEQTAAAKPGTHPLGAVSRSGDDTVCTHRRFAVGGGPVG